MTACGKTENAELNIETMEISNEIDEYMQSFIELYTSNVFEDTKSMMKIEEKLIDYEGGIATLIKYTDLSDKCLRYTIKLYGETMSVTINYYLCENFILVSQQDNYYSSWILAEGGFDILYSKIKNWIIISEKMYILHDDGELEEIEKEKMEVPLLDEIELYAK